MIQLIEQQKFVLTPDFAIKLLILEQRRRSGRSIILSGDTGIGKTEMLSLYSLIINLNSNLIPNVLFKIRKLLISRILVDPNKKSLRATQFQKYFKLKNENQYEPNSIGSRNSIDITQDSLINTYREICESGHFVIAAYETVNYLKKLLNKYFLIKKSKLLERVVDSTLTQPIDIKFKSDQENIIVNNSEELIELVKETLNIKFENLFFSILMHQNVTATKIKKK
eukprot:TRINITY_DN4959_c0_g2_i3.p1 TRINITY_DN4959_c0_g2~~TRINITY_DN4959_c0_g2_i3.p1  ORF type:complete len:225 (+),score=80.64 TRINITY_DN4959_c0_g2_i3:422-1096(+)